MYTIQVFAHRELSTSNKDAVLLYFYLFIFNSYNVNNALGRVDHIYLAVLIHLDLPPKSHYGVL
jgi:hypothetical protein